MNCHNVVTVAHLALYAKPHRYSFHLSQLSIFVSQAPVT